MSSKRMVTADYVASLVAAITHQHIDDTYTCYLKLHNGFVMEATGDSKDDAYGKAFSQLYPFASFQLRQEEYTLSQKVELMSRLCHEVNRAYCEGLGDYSHNKWEDSKQQIRDSVRIGVKAKVEQDLTPEEQHNLWMRTKHAQGWVYGEKKDDVLKTHPCMVPYDMLPREQKTKDLLFQAVVNVMKD